MHVGQWLVASNSSGATKVFSPWFPRGADNAVFTYESIKTVGSATLTITVVHKNREDTGNGTSAGDTWTAVAGSAFKTQTILQLKELVRFEFELTSSSGDAFCLYRMLAPTWFNDAE